MGMGMGMGLGGGAVCGEFGVSDWCTRAGMWMYVRTLVKVPVSIKH